jgi:hypothetical protein
MGGLYERAHIIRPRAGDTTVMPFSRQTFSDASSFGSGWPKRCKLAHESLWEIQLEKAEVGPTSGPTWYLSHLRAGPTEREGRSSTSKQDLFIIELTFYCISFSILHWCLEEELISR